MPLGRLLGLVMGSVVAFAGCMAPEGNESLSAAAEDTGDPSAPETEVTPVPNQPPTADEGTDPAQPAPGSGPRRHPPASSPTSDAILPTTTQNDPPDEDPLPLPSSPLNDLLSHY